jgi:hypothetical protein
MPQNLTWGRRLYCASERSAPDFYRPRPGLNQRTLGPMQSTLTIRPPRTTIKCILEIFWEQCSQSVWLTTRQQLIPRPTNQKANQGRSSAQAQDVAMSRTKRRDGIGKGEPLNG